MKILAILLLILTTPLTIFAKEETNNQFSFEGKYLCKGYDFVSGKPYEEKGEIKRTGKTYSFTRLDPKDGIFYATGLIKNSVLSFVFWNERFKDSFGIASYEVLPNGDLKGSWTFKNSKLIGEDFCKKIN